MRLCGVCTEPSPKYKCPRCELRYCSLQCYKRHKETPCEPSAASLQAATLRAKHQHSRHAVARGSHGNADDDDDDDDDTRGNEERTAGADILPEQLLGLLAESESVRQRLANPHLRAVLEAIVASKRPAKALERELRSTVIFREYADDCLKVLGLSDESSPPSQ